MLREALFLVVLCLVAWIGFDVLEGQRDEARRERDSAKWEASGLREAARISGTTVGPCRSANASAAMSCVCRASASCGLRNSRGACARFLPAMVPDYESTRGWGKGGPLDPPIGDWENREGQSSLRRSIQNIETTGVGVETEAGDDGDAPQELYSRVRISPPHRHPGR